MSDKFWIFDPDWFTFYSVFMVSGFTFYSVFMVSGFTFYSVFMVSGFTFYSVFMVSGLVHILLGVHGEMAPSVASVVQQVSGLQV
jgi:hypothetical protein